MHEIIELIFCSSTRLAITEAVHVCCVPAAQSISKINSLKFSILCSAVTIQNSTKNPMYTMYMYTCYEDYDDLFCKP